MYQSVKHEHITYCECCLCGNCVLCRCQMKFHIKIYHLKKERMNRINIMSVARVEIVLEMSGK